MIFTYPLFVKTARPTVPQRACTPFSLRSRGYFGEVGKRFGTQAWIWSVVVDDGLYVRAYSGQNSSWYKAAISQKAGRITAAGMTKEVTFEAVTGTINDRIDEAYRVKYKDSEYLSPMVGARARSATVKVLPRDDK